MSTHQFTLIVDGADLQDESVVNSLFESGCDDALVGSTDGIQFIDFDREATSWDEAVRSAVADVERVDGVQVIRVNEGRSAPAKLKSKAREEREREERKQSLMVELTSETSRTIAIDWSGALKPKGKIWAAVAVGCQLEALLPQNSREGAIAWLIEQLEQQPNTIAGLDFAFSMPAWFVGKHGCANAIDFWRVVEQEREHWLEGCPHPFWGKEGTKKPEHCELFRETERCARNQVEKSDPKSTFQIGGPGQVGRGSVRGMPFLTRLRRADIAVWPFDERKWGQPTVVEIYPRLFMGGLNKSDQSERIRFLEGRYPDIELEHRNRAAESDDAFDAAVSALSLATRRATPRLLTNAKLAKLEGQIWF